MQILFFSLQAVNNYHFTVKSLASFKKLNAPSSGVLSLLLRTLKIFVLFDERKKLALEMTTALTVFTYTCS